MNRLSLAIAATLMAMPVSALAAYSTPSELMTAVRDNSVPRSFSVTAHAMSDGTYVSVWTSGSEQGSDPSTMQVNAKATVDVVHGNLKVRVKAELLAINGTLYARLVSFDGGYQNAFASISGMLKQHQWVSMPLDEALVDGLTGGTALQVGSADPTDADTMYHMQSAPGKNGGTVYTLSLTQDYAVTLAQLIREMLHDESPSSDDFFPWRQLAEGMRFDNTVVMNGNGGFVSSTFSLSTASDKSSFSVTGSEYRLGSALALKAPTNVVSIDQALASFDDLSNDMTPGADMMDEMMPYEPSYDSGSATEPSMSEGTFNSVDEGSEYMMSEPSADCSDPSLSAGELLMLQRGGSCPVEKRSTRFGGW